MGGPRDYHAKWSQSDERHIWYYLNVKSKEMIQMNLFTKEKQAHRHRKQIYGY